MASPKKVLVTGAAGFIGFHLCKRLAADGYAVTGVDNMNSYYDVQLKQSRLDILLKLSGFQFKPIDLCDKKNIDRLFAENNFNYVVNLAAQAGVRYSLVNPYAYLESNMHGFLNVLEACWHHKTEHLVYASSSSVYGANTKMPFSVHDNVDHPISLYAASKKANELMAHTYSALYNLPTTGLRFFTVYGPYGRPDMALFIFTKAIVEGKPIDVYNNGKMKRDFTYIDDIVEGMVRLIPRIPTPDASWSGRHPDPSSSFAPYRLYNIGNNKPVELMHFIEVLEQKLQRRAVKNFLPIQDGDVPETFADVNDLMRDAGFKPNTTIETGIEKFVTWFKEYYNIT
jgi:UDP-glucuronate 4-epimerase